LVTCMLLVGGSVVVSWCLPPMMLAIIRLLLANSIQQHEATRSYRRLRGSTNRSLQGEPMKGATVGLMVATVKATVAGVRLQ
jgi:hypothetical protein